MRKLKTKRTCCTASEDRTLEDKTSELNMHCHNEACENYGRRNDDSGVDNERNGGEEQYNAEKMDEVGRTTLEVNDICYINGKHVYFVDVR